MLILCSLFQSFMEYCLLQYSSGEALPGSDKLLCSQSHGLPVLAGLQPSALNPSPLLAGSGSSREGKKTFVLLQRQRISCCCTLQRGTRAPHGPQGSQHSLCHHSSKRSTKTARSGVKYCT